MIVDRVLDISFSSMMKRGLPLLSTPLDSQLQTKVYSHEESAVSFF